MKDYPDVSTYKSYVFGFALDGKGSGDFPFSGDRSKQPLWLHLDSSENDCQEILQQFDVPGHAIESLLRPDTRPRTMTIDGGIVLILRVVNANPGDTPDDMISIRLWIYKNTVISIRQRRVFSAQDLKAALEQGLGPFDLQSLILSLIERIADRIAEYVDLLEEKLVTYEAAIDFNNIIKIRSDISSLRREAAGVRRYLAPQRDALDMFSRQSKVFIDADAGFTIHEQSDRVIRYVEDLDLLRERALVLQEELMNTIAQQQNDRMFVLSVVAAIFLPISFVTGLFGMNVAGLPGTEQPASFIMLASFMVLSVVGTLSFFRFKRWL